MTMHAAHRLLTALLCMMALGQVQDASALGLLQAYEAALAHDPAYRAAQFDNEGAKQFEVLGRAHLLPVVSGSYSTQKNRADITTDSPLSGLPSRTEQRRYTSVSATLQLRQPIYHPEGQARARQGLAQTRASEAQFVARSQDLLVRLISLYVAANYAQDQLAQTKAQRDAYAGQRLAALRLFDRGEGTKTDVLEAQAKFDVALAQVLESQDNLTNATDALAAMLGRDASSLGPLDLLADDFQIRPLQPGNFEVWKTTALDANPDLQAQRLTVDIANEEVQKNEAGHLPRLDLIASASKNNSDTINTFKQNANVLSVGVQLTVPLYAGGSVSAAVRQAVANHEKAKAELDNKTNGVLLELRKQFNVCMSSVARTAAAATSLSSARLLVDATEKSVKGGQRTTLDVLNAQQQLFEARRDLALSRYNYLMGYARLRYAAGTLGLDDLQEMAAYFTPVK